MDGCGLFQDDSTPSMGHEGSQNGLMSMKMMKIICLGLHIHNILIQLNIE